MADICCTSCGYVAQYEDISDGDFDVENSMCYPCSVAEDEREEAMLSDYKYDNGPRGGWTHTTDERRFATPMTFRPFCDTDEMDDGTPHDWADVMEDGIRGFLRAERLEGGAYDWADPEVYNEIARDDLIREHSQRVLREIDLLGPKRVQRHLSSGWVPGNVGMQRVIGEPHGMGCGLVKGRVDTSPIMCGGGGGRGGVM
jgi:hypothetical protein